MEEQQDISPSLKKQEYPPLPPHITIEPITEYNLSAFRRIVSLLLPIRYPDKFFSEILRDELISSISRVAVWHHTPSRAAGDTEGFKVLDVGGSKSKSKPLITEKESIVIGGIRCRLEPIPTASPLETPNYQLYIQTLALLSPYRGQGIATALLDGVLASFMSSMPGQESEYSVTSIYAHVWEANTEGLEWYKKRGFIVEGEVLEAYYRKLRPSGARIVKREVGVADWMRLGSD